MSGTPEYIEKFVKFLHDANWHRSILDKVTHFLEAQHFTTGDIDSLLMEVTKTVESNLRATVARHMGKKIPQNRSYGIKLLNLAVDSHLILNREHPLYGFLCWILKGPRNTSHHEFTNYPFNTLVMFMTEANQALEGIENLFEPTHKAYLKTRYDKSEKKIKIESGKILRPDGTPLPNDQKVEVAICLPDKKVKTIPLTQNETGDWQGEYDVRGEACGTLSCYLEGLNHGTHFTTSSGSSVVVSYSLNKPCPKCGHVITSDTSFCPKCGERLRIS